MFGLSPFCGAPFCSLGVGPELEEILQSLTFTQTAVPVLQLLTSSALVFVDTIIANAVENLPITDSLTLTQSLVLNYTHLDEIIQSFSFTQVGAYHIAVIVNEVLTLAQDAGFAWSLNASQTLTLTPVLTLNNIYSNLSEQTLNFIHQGILNYIHNLELCGCLVFDQRAGELIALTVTQALVFTLIETLGVEQTIEFMDFIETNFTESCCGDIFGVPNRETESNFSMTQTVLAGGVYGQSISQSVSLLSTAMWRI